MDVKLPPLGEGADSGTVVSVLIKEGDQITKGQSLLEIETGKAVAPLPSTAAGKVTKIHVKEGAKITVGQLLLTVEGEEAPAAPAAPAKPGPAPEKARPAKPRSAPVATAVAAPPEGGKTPETPDYEYEGPLSPPAAPSVRRLARQLGIDLRKVQGTENGGRIVIPDLKTYIQRLKQLASQPKSGAAPAAAEAAPIDFSRWGQIAKRPMSSLRKVISQRMSENWNAIPHVTQFDQADITHVMDLRKKYNAEYEQKGARLTVTPFVMKVVAAALKKFPAFNASLDTAAGEIIHKEYYNLGLAVDTDQGLIVPVIKNVDRKSMVEISREVNELAAKTRDRKVSMEDLQGGTFTISNQGGIGGAHFTPIVNKPEVAILGLGRGALKPVVRNLAIEARLMLPLCLSYDHRVIDGGEAVRFILEIVDLIENFDEAVLKS